MLHRPALPPLDGAHRSGVILDIYASSAVCSFRAQARSHDVVRGAQVTATGKQIGLIVHIRDQIGFEGDGFDRWLHRQFGVASLDAVADRGLASREIRGLLAMQRNRASFTVPLTATGQ